MRQLQIDITDLGGRANPGDYVLLYSPIVRAAASTTTRVISTAPLRVDLDATGRASIAVDPGPVKIQIRCRGRLDTEPLDLVVPDGTSPIGLRALMESQFDYQPPILSAFERIQNQVSRDRAAAEQARTTVEQSARRAEQASSTAVTAADSARRVEQAARETQSRADVALTSAVGAKTAAEAAAARAAAAQSASTAAAQQVAVAAPRVEQWAAAAQSAAGSAGTAASSAEAAAAEARRIATTGIADGAILPAHMSDAATQEILDSARTAGDSRYSRQGHRHYAVAIVDLPAAVDGRINEAASRFTPAEHNHAVAELRDVEAGCKGASIWNAAGRIPIRSPEGGWIACGDPQRPNHAATQQYVDSADNALTARLASLESQLRAATSRASRDDGVLKWRRQGAVVHVVTYKPAPKVYEVTGKTIPAGFRPHHDVRVKLTASDGWILFSSSGAISTEGGAQFAAPGDLTATWLTS